MGLDIRAYSKLTRITDGQDDDEWESRFDYHTHARLWVNNEFPGRADGIIHKAVYRTDGETFKFRAGSYSGYNRWREWLCRFAFDVPCETLWSDYPAYASKPFAELINFADNEGVIGPECSAKLAKDFDAYADAAWQWAAKTLTGQDVEYFRQSYASWRKAFTLAADGGAVDFH